MWFRIEEPRIRYRTIAVVLCYLLFLLLAEDKEGPAALVGGGLLLASWGVIDKLVVPEHNPQIAVGEIAVGIALLGGGIFWAMSI